MKRKLLFRAGDFVIFFIIAALAAGIWIYLALIQTDQTYGEIWIDSKKVQEIKLDDSTQDTLTLEGREGEVVIQIDGKRMCFIEADCPDHTCIRTGWISHVGQTAVCLPNRVQIKITGSTADGQGVDVVVQ